MKNMVPPNTFENLLILNEKDASICIRIPEGEFEMGDEKDANCPRHTVYLDTYYIGLYPVTNRQYKRFVNATGHRRPNSDAYHQIKKADHPVVCVSWDDALAYCRWAGGNLPTEAQWEKAARGPQGYLYPWGNAWDPCGCRNGHNRALETTCSIHDYPNGVSGYGAYHMAGNVWEWCLDDWYESNYRKQIPAKNPTGPYNVSSRVHRGGSWCHFNPDNFRSDHRRALPPYRNNEVGFRFFSLPGQEEWKSMTNSEYQKTKRRNLMNMPIHELTANLASNDPLARLFAINALAKTGAPGMEAMLAQALADRNPDVRSFAARAMKNVTNLQYVGLLIKCLEDPYWHVRSHAVLALREHPDSLPVAAWLDIAADHDAHIRQMAISALDGIAKKQGIHPLKQLDNMLSLLGSKNEEVRRIAAEALGDIGDPKAVEPFIEALNDTDVQVRRHAVISLGQIGHPKAIESLMNALGHDDELTRNLLFEALNPDVR